MGLVIVLHVLLFVSVQTQLTVRVVLVIPTEPMQVNAKPVLLYVSVIIMIIVLAVQVEHI